MRKLLGLFLALILAAFLLTGSRPQKVHAQPPVLEIIVLTQQTTTVLTLNGVYWIPITSGLCPVTTGSLWVAKGPSVGASSAQVAAINSGSILEVTWAQSWPLGTTDTTIQQNLQSNWTTLNTGFNGVGNCIYYGANYNGTAWAQN